VNWRATKNIPNGKALLITDADTTINGIAFLNAKVTNADGQNGAGIRYQGGNLVLFQCLFRNNQDGLLAAPVPNGTITVNQTWFDHNGVNTPGGNGYGQTHNLYVNTLAKLTVEDSLFTRANIGDQIKSRANVTIIENTRIIDQNGDPSYDVGLSNGGAATITNTTIEKGPNAPNDVSIVYGDEGNLLPNSSLTVQNSILVDDAGFRGIAVKNYDSAVTVSIVDNQVYGYDPSRFAVGPNSQSGNVTLTKRPTIPIRAPWKK
jgi:hypothetical protein